MKFKIAFVLLAVTLQGFSQSNLQRRMMEPSADFLSLKQELTDYYLTQPGDTVESSDKNEFHRWVDFWSNRIDYSDGQDAKFSTSAKMMFDFWLHRPNYCDTSNDFQGNWISLGPDTIAGQNLGMITAVWVHPTIENTILAGSEAGGLWKSVNGGATWNNITDGPDGLPSIGVQDIAVNPDNLNEIWIATGLALMNKGYGIGICYSLNGGANWQVDTLFLQELDSNNITLPYVNALKFKPSGSGYKPLFALVGNKILKKLSNGNWVTAFQSSKYYEQLDDIEFNSFNSNIMYVTGTDANAHSGGVEIVKSIDGGGTFFSFNPAFIYNQNLIPDEEFNLSLPFFSNSGNCAIGYFNWYYFGTGSGSHQWHPAGISGSTYAEIIPQDTNFLFTAFKHNVPLAEGGTYDVSFICSKTINTKLELWFTEDDCFNEALSLENSKDTLLWSSNSAFVNDTISFTFSLPPVPVNSWGKWYFSRLVMKAIGISSNNDTIKVDRVRIISASPTKINLSLTDSTTVFAMYLVQGRQTYIGKSANGGLTWTTAVNPIGFSYTSSGGSAAPLTSRMEFEVSRQDESLMYCGVNEMWRSDNGGANFKKISTYNGTPTHADIRYFILYTSTGSKYTDVLFMGNDGGIGKKKTGDTIFFNINGKGLAIGDYWGLSTTEYDHELITAGAMHDGLFYGYKTWKGIHGTDEFGTEADRIYNDTLFNLNQGSGGGASSLIRRRMSQSNLTGASDIRTLPFYDLAQHPNKPLFVHPKSGRLYVGFNDLYYSDRWRIDTLEQDSAYLIPFIVDPVFGNNNDLQFYAITNFDVNYSDTKKKYVIYDEPIFRSTHVVIRHDSAAGIWSDITLADQGTINIPSYMIHPTDIVTDPLNPDELWVTCGDFAWNLPQFDTLRVFHSTNAGVSWEDASDGLPPFPVNCITYQYGSDDIVYVGTDVGVYVWNKNFNNGGSYGKWECFNSGLPACIVSELEINYCAGKLRASSYGRGLWESDLRYESTKSAEAFVSDTTWWNKSERLIENFILDSGQVLIVSDSAVISFPANGFLKVMPGAKLIIDSATLTNSCGYMWGGVQVVGDPHQDQSLDANDMPLHQGMLIMENDAKIENAYVAVMADEAYYTGLDYVFPNALGTNGGGIIKIDESSFINNRNGVGFGPYQFSSNVSRIWRSDFYTDYLNTPYETDGAYQFISMWDAHGIEIKGNTFTDVTNRINLNRTTGILTIDADYTVAPYCLSIQPCSPLNEFNDLGYGIYAIVANPYAMLGNLTITGNDFNDNFRGIYLSAFERPVVTFNDITVIAGHDSTYGAYLNVCQDFRVEENLVSGYGDKLSYGIIVNNSNIDPYEANYNVLYKNYFSSLDVGACGYHENRGLLYFDSGLEFRCNEFTSTDYAIAVIDGGIKRYQGDCSDPPIDPAGNLFYDSLSTGNYHLYWNEVNDFQNSIKYFHHSNSPYVPLLYTTNYFGLSDCGITGDEGDCPGKGEEEKSSAQRMADIEDYENQTADLKELIDGGEKEYLLSQINDPNISSATLKNELLAAGPYLSDTVLNATIEKSEPMTNNDLKDVILDNSPVMDTVFTVLEEEAPPVANNSVVESAQEGLSDRDFLYAEISNLTGKRSSELRDLINQWVEEGKSDSAKNYLLEKGEVLKALPFVVQSGDYSTAQTMINSLPENSSNEENAKAYLQFMFDAKVEEKDMMNLSTTDLAFLEGLADPNTLTGNWALNQLLVSTGQRWEEDIPVFEEQAPRLMDESYLDESLNYFTLQPNPATDEVMILVSDFSETSFMEIYDLIGNKVATMPVSSSQILFDISDMSSGIYFFQLKDGEEVLETKKLVVGD